MSSDKASEELLAALHGALGKEFLRRIENGQASPSDLNAARQYLKDNNISCDGPRSPGMNALMDSLPDLPEEEGWQ